MSRKGAIRCGREHSLTHLLTLSIDDAKHTTNEILRAFGGALVSGEEDTRLIGTPGVLVECVKRHKERLVDSGLKLQIPRTKCYIKR